jgi:hypothetical protein
MADDLLKSQNAPDANRPTPASHFNDQGEPPERVIPKSIRRTGISWKFWFGFWNGIHYGLGVASVVLSVLVADKDQLPPSFKDNFVYYGIASAALAGIVTFMGAKEKASGFFTARKDFEAAILEFRSDPNLPDSWIYSAMKKASEKMPQE